MNKYVLYWLSKSRNKRMPAGVAFYDEQFGEFRFRLDFFPNTDLYLKATAYTDAGTRYRLEIVKKGSNGKFLRRLPVGSAYESENGETIIEAFPFERSLVLVSPSVSGRTKGSIKLQEVI